MSIPPGGIYKIAAKLGMFEHAMQEEDGDSIILDLGNKGQIRFPAHLNQYVEQALDFRARSQQIPLEDPQISSIEKIKKAFCRFYLDQINSDKLQQKILKCADQILQAIQAKHRTIQEMRKLVQQYIEKAKNSDTTDPEIDEIYKQLTESNSISFNYIGYFEKSLLEQLFAYTCKCGHLALAKRLVEKEQLSVNCEISEEGIKRLPLELAIEQEQLAIIAFLMERGAATTKKWESSQPQFSALKTAVGLNSEKSLAILLKHGCAYTEINDLLSDKTLKNHPHLEFIKSKKAERASFLAACKANKLEEVAEKISQNVFIDAHDTLGRNALFLAVSNGNFKVVKLLIAHNATISYPLYKRTSLMKALEKYKDRESYFKILVLLCHKELQVELLDDDKDNPFNILAKMVSTLLYKSMRYAWDSPACSKFRQHVQHFLAENNWHLDDNLENYRRWMEKRGGYAFGSYLSSDSDSDEEALYLSLIGQEEDGFMVVQELEESKKTQVNALQNKLVEWEAGEYLSDASRSQSKDKQTEILMEKRVDEARRIWGRQSLVNLRTVLSDDRNHFKGGQLYLQGTVSRDLYPVYDPKKGSPLLDRSRVNPVAKGIKPEDCYFATYRGYTYITSKWNQAARRAHREKNELGLPFYSMAVQFDTSNTSNFRELHQYESGLSPAEKRHFEWRKRQYATLLKKKLTEIRDGNKARLQFKTLDSSKLSMFNNFTYDNLSELLQTIYTTNYDLYFRVLNTEFFRNRVLSRHSPFISTAETPYHALKYAYGVKTFPGHQDEALNPRWLSNGRAQRPYAGKVYVILHPNDEVKKAHRITSLLFQGKSIVPKEIAPEREISHFAYLDQDRIVYQHVAKYPSFHQKKYKAIYEYKYGLDQKTYQSFRRWFFQIQDKKTSEQSLELIKFTNLLAEYLCAFHEMRLVKIAERGATKRGGVLVYLDEFGQIKRDGQAATYYTPYMHMAEGSPVKAKKESIAAKRDKRKNPKSYSAPLLIDETIFTSQKTRAKRIAQLIFNMKNSKKFKFLSTEKLFNDSEKSNIIKEIVSIEKEYTTILHYALVNGIIPFAFELIKLIPVKTNSQVNVQIPVPYEYINLQDKYGNTPLHLAALNREKDLYQQLLERGAESEVMNHQGLFPKEMEQGILILNSQTKISIEREENYSANTMPSSSKGGATKRLDFDSLLDNKNLTKAQPDTHARDNAFKQFDNLQYQYQGPDIDAIAKHLIGKSSQAIVVKALGEGVTNDAVTLLEQNKIYLEEHKRLVGVYNTGKNHWIAFVISQEGSNLQIRYKDSFGKKRRDFEQDIEQVFQIKPTFYEGCEQYDGVSCGLFALKNMQIFAEMTHEELVNSTKISFFCPSKDSYDATLKELRKDFAILYASQIYSDCLNDIGNDEHRKEFRKSHKTELNFIKEQLQSLELQGLKTYIAPSDDYKNYQYKIICNRDHRVQVEEGLKTMANLSDPNEDEFKTSNDVVFWINPNDVFDDSLRGLITANNGKEMNPELIIQRVQQRVESDFIQALNIENELEDQEIIAKVLEFSGIDLRGKINILPGTVEATVSSPGEIPKSPLLAEDAYEGYWKAASTEKTLLEASRKEGKIEGKMDERTDIARNMKAKGLPINVIAECTNLSADEVEKL